MDRPSKLSKNHFQSVIFGLLLGFMLTKSFDTANQVIDVGSNKNIQQVARTNTTDNAMTIAATTANILEQISPNAEHLSLSPISEREFDVTASTEGCTRLSPHKMNQAPYLSLIHISEPTRPY